MISFKAFRDKQQNLTRDTLLKEINRFEEDRMDRLDYLKQVYD